MQLQRKSIHLGSCEIKFSANDSGVFEGYGARFNNIDSYGDIIAPGAFAKVVKAGVMPKMFFNHMHYDVPIGKYTSMSEDANGLYVKGQMTKGLDMAEQIRIAMQDQTVDGLSIGFRAGETEQREDGVRVIKTIDELPEISVVTFPANESARIDLTSVKSQLQLINSISDFESFLRDAGGFSNGLTKALVSRAKDLFQRDAGPDLDAKALEELMESINGFRGRVSRNP